jgi:2-oxoglutarate ferredoxin oxidoreductase subunit gamma
MSQEAYGKFVPELKDGGILIVEQDLVRVSELPGEFKVFSVPATRIAEELGKRMVLNSVMVGFFTAVTRLVNADAVRKAVADSVPPSFRELNLKAFEKGFEYGSTAQEVTPADIEETMYAKE